MYIASLEEMEVAGDLGAGVLQGHEFVEGHHDKPGVIVLLLLLFRGHQLRLCKRNGICAEAATGSGKEGTDAGRARREGEAGVASRGGERPEEEREEAVEVVVDGGRHGFHAILWMTISRLNTCSSVFTL
jgi:hypothetical protein